ncbi:MAG: hypothetical protein QNI88_12575 [Desulfobacterales bacterium]|nr:hypothetical protein [Desulfobacterales bacterium]
MRTIMIVGLLVVMLIAGILTMQNLGVRSSDGKTEIQARDSIDQAEDAAEAAKAKVQDLEERLNRND